MITSLRVYTKFIQHIKKNYITLTNSLSTSYIIIAIQSQNNTIYKKDLQLIFLWVYFSQLIKKNLVFQKAL